MYKNVLKLKRLEGHAPLILQPQGISHPQHEKS